MSSSQFGAPERPSRRTLVVSIASVVSILLILVIGIVISRGGASQDGSAVGALLGSAGDFRAALATAPAGHGGRWSNSVVMIISGSLSIGIGILLLATDGTAGLGGLLTVSDQFRLESAASDAASAVPNTAFMVAAAALLALAVVLNWRNRRHPKPGETDRTLSKAHEEESV